MPRKTKFNYIYSPELEAQFCEQNKFLLKSFIDYLKPVDKSKGTIEQYYSDLRFFKIRSSGIQYPPSMEERWQVVHAEYVDKAAWVKQMLAL